MPRFLHERRSRFERRDLPCRLEDERPLEGADRVHVLDLDLGAQRVRSHGAHRHVRVAAERSLLHPDVGDVEGLEQAAELAEVCAGFLG